MLFIALKNRLSHVTKDEIKVQKGKKEKMSFLFIKIESSRRNSFAAKTLCCANLLLPEKRKRTTRQITFNDSKSHLIPWTL